MKLKGKNVLITGANGGIGRALVMALLERGAAKVYAAARSADAVAELIDGSSDQVMAVRLDVTQSASVRGAAEQCRDVELVINNAGVNRCMGFMGSSAMEDARLEMEVNYFGTLAMCRAFAPVLASRGGGAIVNVCSIIGLVNLPVNGTYCASKAAGHSLLQGLRAELAPRGIRVIGVYPGPVDTKMTAGQEMPKATPDEVAAAILAGVEMGDEYIFPDPMSRHVHAMLEKDPRQVERDFGAMVGG
ncbi:SDR family oxidoreductase [Geobacter sulfurreducens]|uniref:SDR family oxidoreductase n=1 Tax=Geobacter sulfurreducens TaxID=35554 RepID=UPI0001D8F29C|nr:SDR family oxidoreductase [Geobacter sulfurreducens]ADI85875.1 oxidoreductase, short-chain dehydrogenase/reductase family [Geobacter sulfurreducens KN400]UTG92435.1 SDR family oxidoreductase [Geobacter sulfurreducens]